MAVLAKYEMPKFTTRADARALAAPHGLALESFMEKNGYNLATFRGENAAQVAGLSADLDYQPVSVA